VHEAALKVGAATKAPDYAFRIAGDRKLNVEARKPSTRLRDQPTAAYQLRRYAWSAKLPLSILTDFDEFAVYDCRRRPRDADDASVGRIEFLTYAQYPERLDYLYGTFSRDAIVRGSFDRFVEDTRRHRGTAEVDLKFLAEIEAWREGLAKDIARHDELSVHDLNFAVQATIDRIPGLHSPALSAGPVARVPRRPPVDSATGTLVEAVAPAALPTGPLHRRRGLPRLTGSPTRSGGARLGAREAGDTTVAPGVSPGRAAPPSPSPGRGTQAP
jgi:hypothetical protein